jgi:PAS domain S-box-containing protein
MDESIKQSVFTSKAAIVLLLICGLLASIVGSRVAQNRIAELEQVRFAQQVEPMMDNIRLRLHTLSLGLLGARAIPLLSNGELRPHYFRRYISGLDLNSEFVGALGMGFVRKVNSDDLEGYLSNQRHYRPDFTIKSSRDFDLSANGDLYVVEYIEPLSQNQAYLGLNLAAEPQAKAAALRAMKSSAIVLSDRINLNVAGKKEPGFLMLLPFYLNTLEVPAGFEIENKDREQALVGWLFMPIAASQLMAGMEGILPPGTDVEIFDGVDLALPQLLFDFDGHIARLGNSPDKPRKYVIENKIEFGGQVWTVRIGSNSLSNNFQYWLPNFILFLGLGFTLIVVIILLAMNRIRNSAVTLAERMSYTARQRELQMNAVFDSTPDAIILADSSGMIVAANHTVERIFGYQSASIIGSSVGILMPKVLADQHQGFIERYCYRGVSTVVGQQRDLWAVRIDGQQFPVEIHLNQFEFDDKTYLVAQISDISLRYAAEQNLLESKRRLDLVLDCAGLGTWDLDLLTNEAAFGGIWGEMLGYQTSSLIPNISTWRDLVHPEDLPVAYAALLAHVNQQDGNYSCEMRMRNAQGHWQWVLAVGRIYERDEQGEARKIAGIHLDIDARKKNELMLLEREAELTRLQSQLSGVINAATEISIIATDTEGVIRVFSPGAERMLGYSASELLNTATPAILHEPSEILLRSHEIEVLTGDVVSGFEVFAYFAKRGQRDVGEWSYICKSGNHIQVRLAITAIVDSVGVVTGYLAVAVNITEHIQLQHAMALAKENAESANRAKSDFLANMSHEIRTPMNAVIGFSALLTQTELTNVQQDYLNSIQQSGEALLNLINDLLDFSKIEAGHLDLESIEFDLRHTLEGALDIVSEKANRSNLDLACLVEPSVPQKLIGDPGRLRQVMLNLLNNAIKFTHQGEVVARVSATVLADQRCRLRVTVKDSGIGMTAEVKQKLFQPFTQADSSTTRRFGGTGLGLSICKRIVEAMQGEIGVESEAGMGALFWFEVELSVAQRSYDVSASNIDLKGATALVVDDFAANRELLALQLESLGVKVLEFSDSRLALAQLQADTPALTFALLDMQLPGVDGLAFARALHALPTYHQLPLILLTSMAVPGLAAEARDAEFSGFLTKPIRQSQLQMTIEAALQMHVQPAQAKQLVTVHLLAEQIAAQKPYVLLAEDNPVNQKVAVLMLEKLGCRVDVVDNGLLAVEAVQQHQYAMVLMDCQMPHMDGFAATEAIRALGGYLSQLPIVALTANAFQSDIDQCLAAGMNDFISKPVRAEQLQRVLVQWVIQYNEKKE